MAANGCTVRIVAMSDTHGFQRGLPVPDGDLLVHCGDATGKEDRRKAGVQMEEFARWFRRLPHREKLFVKGNHEEGLRVEELLGNSVFAGSRTCLGLRLHAQPFSRDGRYKPLPQGVDVLLSHEPPRGVLDLGLDAKGGKPRNCGSGQLREALVALRGEGPRLHIFGHIHEARGTLLANGTLFVNAANANAGRAKRLEHGCVVLEVPLGTERFRGPCTSTLFPLTGAEH